MKLEVAHTQAFHTRILSHSRGCGNPSNEARGGPFQEHLFGLAGSAADIDHLPQPTLSATRLGSGQAGTYLHSHRLVSGGICTPSLIKPYVAVHPLIKSFGLLKVYTSSLPQTVKSSLDQR